MAIKRNKKEVLTVAIMSAVTMTILVIFIAWDKSHPRGFDIKGTGKSTNSTVSVFINGEKTKAKTFFYNSGIFVVLGKNDAISTNYFNYKIAFSGDFVSCFSSDQIVVLPGTVIWGQSDVEIYDSISLDADFTADIERNTGEMSFNIEKDVRLLIKY
jgi:hypothetical protein